MPNAAPDSIAETEALARLRAPMLSYARSKIDNPSVAEDCVQEALLGALEGISRFNRASTLKTWVFSILRFKLADAMRRQKRFADADAVTARDEAEQDFSVLFDEKGHWHPDSWPQRWQTPDDAASEQQLRTIIDLCVEHLPPRHAQIFLMREVLTMDTPTIVQATGLTTTHINVNLYRARMRLRECLNTRWFADTGETTS